MLQDLPPEVGWDVRTIYVHVPASWRIYVLFLLTVCIVTLVKLLRVWLGALPFRLSRKAGDRAYLSYLQTLATSLNHWIAFTYLGLGTYVGFDVYDAFGRILDQKLLGTYAALATVQQLAGAFTMALAVILFAFLVRWHVVNRIAHLQTP